MLSALPPLRDSWVLWYLSKMAILAEMIGWNIPIDIGSIDRRIDVWCQVKNPGGDYGAEVKEVEEQRNNPGTSGFFLTAVF
jgi:hypothetical protein